MRGETASISIQDALQPKIFNPRAKNFALANKSPVANRGALDHSEHSNSLMNSKALNLSDDNIASQGDSRILKDLTRSYHSDDMPSEQGM